MTTQTILSIAQVAGVIATAILTFFLVKVTMVLARETSRLADVGQRPQIVAILGPNPKSMIHFDIVVENTGTATAYDIDVQFDPPLPQSEKREKVPLGHIDVLKPNQSMSSYLCPFSDLEEAPYQVTISWARRHGSADRESNAYTFDLGNLRGISKLGEDPAEAIAKEMKKVREEVSRISSALRNT